jgi:Fur family ferric uptake transcriptional regulator
MSIYFNNEYENIIKEKGFKLTNQRKMILEVLYKNSSKHMTVEEIYNTVKKKCPEIGLATVYRTIQLLSELKLIGKLNLDDGFTRYEIGELTKRHYHHHLICEKCGKVIEVKDDLLESTEQLVYRNHGFKVTNHIVKFYGICDDCDKESSTE